MDLEALCVGLSRQDQPLARNTQVIKHGKAFVIVLGILQNPQSNLLDVAEAGCLTRLLASPGKDREENCASMAIMAITTSSSIRVKPVRLISFTLLGL